MKYGTCGYKFILLISPLSLFCMESREPHLDMRWVEVRETVTRETPSLAQLQKAYKEKKPIEAALKELSENKAYIHDVRALFYAAARDNYAELIPYFATHREFEAFKNAALFTGLTARDIAEEWKSYSFVTALNRYMREVPKSKPQSMRFSIRGPQ